MTRAPTIFGTVLMVAGALLYFVDMDDGGRNMHWFVVPALLLMALGVLFTFIGRVQQRSAR